MGKIAEAWADYERKVLPRECGSVQRTETRRAFYAGAVTVFGALVHGLGSNPDVYSTEDEALMDGIKAECEQFLADVMARKG